MQRTRANERAAYEQKRKGWNRESRLLRKHPDKDLVHIFVTEEPVGQTAHRRNRFSLYQAPEVSPFERTEYLRNITLNVLSESLRLQQD